MTVGLLNRDPDPRLDEVLRSSRTVGDRLEEVAARLEAAVQALESEINSDPEDGAP